MSVRKRILPSGTIRWQVDYADTQGKRRSRQFKTKREADAFRDQAAVEVRRGTHVHDRDTYLVRDAGREWILALEGLARVGQYEPTTVRVYSQHIRLHICDPEIGLGHRRMVELTPGVVENFANNLFETRSPIMTRKVISTLVQLIDYAKRQGWVVENNARGLKLRPVSRTKPKIEIPQPMSSGP